MTARLVCMDCKNEMESLDMTGYDVNTGMWRAVCGDCLKSYQSVEPFDFNIGPIEVKETLPH